MQVERLMYAQYESIQGSYQGNNLNYVCLTIIETAYECLDIASTTTLLTSANASAFNDTYTSTSGSLNGNTFIHSDFMVNVATEDMYASSGKHIFGMQPECSDKPIGDGVVNGFDIYIFGMAQFRLGPYASIGNELDQVITVSGRNDTKDRCNTDPYDRLEWQQRVSTLPCFTKAQESDYQLMISSRSSPPPSLPPSTPPSSGRRLQSIDETHPYLSHIEQDDMSSPLFAPMLAVASRVHNNYHSRAQPEAAITTSASHIRAPYSSSWSAFNIYGVSIHATQNSSDHDFYRSHGFSYTNNQIERLSPLTAASLYSPTSSTYPHDDGFPPDMNARMFQYSEHDTAADGAWYWINVPGIHASVDITVLGAKNTEPVALSNSRAPMYDSDERPVDASKFELRFIRHREFYDKPIDECATIGTSRSPLIAMQNGVISLSQTAEPSHSLCGFDLMLWRPASAQNASSTCVAAIAAGSASMDGLRGTLQSNTECAVPFSSSGPGTSPPPSPSMTSSPAPPQNQNILIEVTMTEVSVVLITLTALSCFFFFSRNNSSNNRLYVALQTRGKETKDDTEDNEYRTAWQTRLPDTKNMKKVTTRASG